MLVLLVPGVGMGGSAADAPDVSLQTRIGATGSVVGQQRILGRGVK